MRDPLPGPGEPWSKRCNDRLGRSATQRENPIEPLAQSIDPETTAMAQPAISSDLARLTAAEFARFFRHLATRVERAVRAVSEQQLWTKPFSFGNSIGHLVLHLTGNLNHYIGALVAGSGYVRHREFEFTDPARRPVDELLADFHRAVDLVVQTLESQDAAAFATPVADQPPIETRLGLFLVCAAHMNNHIGQMSYLVQALQASTNEPPVW
jgi:uncharacterized damage-inducible protein DinB